jgi:two-component system chemotaxis sensor kinase CheA
MTSDPRFVDQFLDDYFAECEEHLGTVRQSLLQLDELTASVAPGTLNSLMRALHTLKGLSGMVGLVAAERVAHVMEDGVRHLVEQPKIPNPELIDALFDGEQLLEACVAARRAHGDPPSIDAFVRDVSRLIRDPMTAESLAETSEPAEEAPHRAVVRVEPTFVSAAVDGVTQRFEFTPSAERSARGLGVEVIRERLETMGEILQVRPRVQAGAGLRFEFLVAMRPRAAAPEAWRLDGLTWEVVENGPDHEIAPHEPEHERPDNDDRSPGGAAPVAAASSNQIRVDLARLEDVMRLVGDMVVSRARLEQALAQALQSVGAGNRRTADAFDDLTSVSERLEHQLRSLREGVMRIRLVHVGELFERMRFAIREIGRDAGKEIRLELQGQTTEIDKVVVDRMMEPLLHLVRNAASHGIEDADARIAAGKPSRGTIALRARAAGERIILEVQDDGGGIDTERVLQRARELGLATPNTRDDPDQVLNLLCTPGFSTRASADMTSGRGVGMAVVRATIRGLGGELFVASTRGHGTTFTIELPLTLMIADALLVHVGDQVMAVPQIALREIVALDPAMITRLENNEVISYRGSVLPLIDLRRTFRMVAPAPAKRHVLVVGDDAHRTGMIVDTLVGLREIVIHPVSDPLVVVPGVSGATELPDGRVSLILDAAALVRQARGRAAAPHTRAIEAPPLHQVRAAHGD